MPLSSKFPKILKKFLMGVALLLPSCPPSRNVNSGPTTNFISLTLHGALVGLCRDLTLVHLHQKKSFQPLNKEVS